MNPMKINYTLYGIALTGGVRTLLTLANGLAKKGHEVSFNILERRVKIDLPINKKINITQGNVPWFIKFFDPMFYIYSKGTRKTDYLMLEGFLGKMGIKISFDLDKALYNTIPEADVSVATAFPTAFPVHLSKSKAKIYQMQHFETLFSNSQYDTRRVLASYKLPLTRIANSSWLKNKLKEELNVNSNLVPWGIDTEIFNTKKIESKNLSKIFNRSEKYSYILSLGKSTRWKGLPELFAALEYIKKKEPNLKLILILYGQEPTLKNSSPIECEYVFKPSDKELVYLYQNSDVVVTPSHSESFPLPPLEGMACGAKVVTTPYGVEDYSKNGYNSIIVKPNDIKSLAEGIIKAITDERFNEILRKNGPRTAKQFTWKKSINKIEAIYKKSLDVTDS